MPRRKKCEASGPLDSLKEQNPPVSDVHVDSPSDAENRDCDEDFQHFMVPFHGKSITCEQRGGAGQEKPALVFTHGAGGGIRAPAMTDFATAFAKISPIVCYHGSMNLTNRIKTFRAVMEHEKMIPVALGGRSMGARAAVLTVLERLEADEELHVEALVLVSYPLMAGSRGEKREPERREKILTDLPSKIDVLFVVGSQDAQCDLDALCELRKKMKARSWLAVVEGADHGMNLKPRLAVQPMRWKTGELAAHWLQEREAEKRLCSLAWDDEYNRVISNGWQADS